MMPTAWEATLIGLFDGRERREYGERKRLELKAHLRTDNAVAVFFYRWRGSLYRDMAEKMITRLSAPEFFPPLTQEFSQPVRQEYISPA